MHTLRELPCTSLFFRLPMAPRWAFCCLVLLCVADAAAQLPNPEQIPYPWKTDTAKHTSAFADLHIAAEKDAIRTLDFPSFIAKDHPQNTYYEYEPAIVIQFGNEARAYPLSVLTLFELANDSIGGKQVMVTFCPMCHAALVYNRTLKTPAGEKTFTFGVSGLLLHNDMVMYDHQTETWWEQLMGSGIAGDYSGKTLRMLPALLISVKDFFDRYPEGKILSPDALNTYIKTHRHRPYHHLEHSGPLSGKYYLPEKTDPRLPPQEHVLDIRLEGHDRIYPFHALAKAQVVNETVGETPIVIFYHQETVTVLDKDDLSKSKRVGSATVFESKLNGVSYSFHKAGDYFIDDRTKSMWDITGLCREGQLKGQQLTLVPHSHHFAFAYLAFYPDAEIYGVQSSPKKKIKE
ncbi:MAG: DUF3179 domain-containing protein [Bacteroidetes bacterium]|nr:DUF3179 domain-containing protein [Bacteroidota bacterium]